MHRNPALLQLTTLSSSEVAMLKLTILLTRSLSKIKRNDDTNNRVQNLIIIVLYFIS